MMRFRARLADAAYRLLLLAFPRPFRREFRADMLDAFRQLRAEAPRTWGGAARFWALAAWDAVAHGFAERGRLAAGRLRRLRPETWPHQATRSLLALGHDTRYAVRMFRRAPGSSAIAVITLALGIGANTAIFSAVDAVLLRPLPYTEPERLVMVWEKRPAEGVTANVVAPADYLDWAAANRVFGAMAAQTTVAADLTGRGEPVRIVAGAVSPSFFRVFDVKPLLGRTFFEEEVTIGRHRVVVLGHAVWQERFGGDRGIVGSRVVLNGVPHEVVGVLPPSFEYLDQEIGLWAPLALGAAPSRTLHSLFVYARLMPGVSLARAREEMDAIGRRLEREYPEANRGHGAHVVALHDELSGPVRTGLLLLSGAVGFVLLIACVNVANLLLAAGVKRRREMAVRAAIGARPGRLVRQALAESAVLALVGGLAGLAVAAFAAGPARRLAPPEYAVFGLAHVSIDLRVLLFTFGVSAATGLLFGLVPAWQAAGRDIVNGLRDGGRVAAGRRRLRTSLVVGEVALASLLLVGTGLALRSFAALWATEPGFRLDSALTTTINLPRARYGTAVDARAAIDRLEERLASVPGVDAVGSTSHLPLSGHDSRSGVTIEEREPTPDAPTRMHPRSVSPGYFRAMRISLAAGRAFTRADDERAPLVAVVNEAAARRFWPGTNAVGRRFRFNGASEGWREVIGVVRDVRHWGLARAANPEVYLPVRQDPSLSMTYVLATRLEPGSIAGEVRSAVRRIDAELVVSNLRSMRTVAAESVQAPRAALVLLGLFGLVALVLASAGIYGVVAHLVTLRTSEIGIRVALGARPRTVTWLILRDGVLPTVAGLAIGLGGAVVVMRSVRASLYEVSPVDPLTFASVAVLLLAAAGLACVLPVRRALRVDPIAALRAE